MMLRMVVFVMNGPNFEEKYGIISCFSRSPVEAYSWSEATVSGILSRSRVRHFPTGTTVLAEDDECNDEAYVIVNGAVEVSI